MKTLAALFLLAAAPLLAQQRNLNKAEISIPGVQGVLKMDVGPTTWEARVRPDGKEVQLRAMNRQDKLVITAFLQRVSFRASAEECRSQWWSAAEKNLPVKIEDVHQYEKDGIAAVEYTVEEFRGQPVHEKAVHAYVGSRDLCAEVHLSKIQFVPADQRLFDDVLATVSLEPDVAVEEQPRPNEQEQYFAEGSRLYMQQNYRAATTPYQKALDLEKQNHTLGKSFFRVLVDNLGMAYGMTGRLPQAKETFEYGLTQDPEYPMFYYNLACTYGEMGKMDESLDQLRLAYKYRANVIPGEGGIPDPIADDSFRKFVKDKKFVDAVREMQRQ
jgi:tetratricopeptide (TPR) repeat protein